LRLGSRDNKALAIAALRRAMSLWTDNFVRGSCGDAMAPAASLALTALKEFTKANCENLNECTEFEVAPGLDIDKLITTCLSELDERAGSSEYSVKCLELLAEATWTTRPIWTRLPTDRRAEVLLVIADYLEENGTKEVTVKAHNPGTYNAKIAVPRGALLQFMEQASGNDDVVWTAAAENELLGPKNPGGNVSARGIIHYFILNGVTINAAVMAKSIDEWRFIPVSEKKATTPLLKELFASKQKCLKLARGAMSGIF